MKEILSLLLSIVILAGCGNTTKEETSGKYTQDEQVHLALDKLKVEEVTEPERFGECSELTNAKLQTAVEFILDKSRKSIKEFGTDFKSEFSHNGKYIRYKNDKGWGQGFTTGQYWICYDLSRDERFADAAMAQVPSFKKRIEEQIGVNHHDMGFLYIPSCVEAYKEKKSKEGREAAILAADHLISRYNPTGMFIQAWGDQELDDNYRLIVDCLMNIPILYWATDETGDEKYADIAYKHYKATAGNAVRSDGSTYHTYWFDASSGEPVKGTTAQGVGDDSAWARGQAWTIYGFPLTYEYKKNDDALTFFKAVSKYYLNRLPKDYIPYWDLSFTDGDDEPRDSSAAAIAACGLLCGAKYLDDADRDKALFTNAAKQIINSLIDNYLATNTNGLLLHATYSKPDNIGIDEMNIWGDYYFAKAIQMLVKQ